MDDFFIFPIESGKNQLKANFKTTGGTKWVLEKKMRVEEKLVRGVRTFHANYTITVTKQNNLDKLYFVKLEAYTLDSPDNVRKLWKSWAKKEKKGKHKSMVFEVFSFDLTIYSPFTNIPGILKLVLIPISLLCDEMLLEPPYHSKSNAIKEVKKLDKLSENMEALLHSGNLYDVILTADSVDIKAHKLILSARSSVFARMFDTPMKENLENKVTITNLDADVLKDLIFYIYTGRITLKDPKHSQNLYVAADLYDLPQLREVCSAWLKFVTLDSAVDTLMLANDYDDQELKEAAMTFISKHTEEIKRTEKWALLLEKRPPLAIEMLSYMFDTEL